METQIETTPNDSMLAALRSCMPELMESLKNEKVDDAAKLITQVADARDETLYQSVGKLTRGLHDAIVNFSVDSGKECTVEKALNNECEISDASSRLEYVIKLTQDAADKTMDMVESCTPLSMSLGEDAVAYKKEWERLKNREMSPDEFRELYLKLDGFFEKIDTNSTQLNGNLQNIILEQGYQDLTGQVLKRVIGLVTEVEENLVTLVRMAGQIEDEVGIEGSSEKNVVNEGPDIVGEGPQIQAEQRADVVNGQDDVDDLLSSLGF